MSAFFTAAVLVSAAVGVGTSIYSANKAEDANDKAIEANKVAADKATTDAKAAAAKRAADAKAAAAEARRAEVFAETEGQGVGNIGEVSLSIDEEIDDEEIALRQGSLRV